MSSLLHILYRQMLLTATVEAQPFGTVYDRFGSLSHVTAPDEATLMNLYSNVVPAGSDTV